MRMIKVNIPRSINHCMIPVNAERISLKNMFNVKGKAMTKD